MSFFEGGSDWDRTRFLKRGYALPSARLGTDEPSSERVKRRALFGRGASKGRPKALAHMLSTRILARPSGRGTPLGPARVSAA